MKNILYILVTLALFSYILAKPADAGDSDLKKRDTSEAGEDAAKIEDKGKEAAKEGAEKKNESPNGKPQAGLEAMIAVPFKLMGGIFDMGEDMFDGFQKGMEGLKN